MVAATQCFGCQSVAKRNRTRAMAADIMECADHAVGATYRDHRQARAVADDMVAGLAQPAGVAQQVPAAIKDRAALQRHRGWIAIPACRQCDQRSHITLTDAPPVTTIVCEDTDVPSGLSRTTV